MNTQNTQSQRGKRIKLGLAALGLAIAAGWVGAHGDVTPQAVDTTSLPQLGDEWLEANPFRGNAQAIRIGDSAYNQNCARCHGLGGISGGIAPDLRKLIPGDDFEDEFYIQKVRNGVTRNNAVYMPPFEGILTQEAMWAIRAWLETVHEE